MHKLNNLKRVFLTMTEKKKARRFLVVGRKFAEGRNLRINAHKKLTSD